MTNAEQTEINVQPADQPLDVSAFLVQADSPELAEYKKTVLKVAQLHSRRHHCGSISEVLAPLGLNKENAKIKVKVETQIGFEFEVKIEPDKLANKTLDEQKVAIAEAIGSFTVGQGVGSFNLKPEMITRMEVVTPFRSGSAAEGNTVHDGGLDELPGAWLYASVEGRVRHYFPNLRIEEDYHPTLIRDSDGRSIHGEYRPWYAACGAASYEPQVTSPRSQGTRCAGCRRNVESNDG